MTGNPAVEPTDGEETGPGEGVTLPSASPAMPTVPAAPATPSAPLPSYGPPSYSPGYEQQAYGSGFGQPAYGPGPGYGYGGPGSGPGYGPGSGYGPGAGYGPGSGYGPGAGYSQPGMRAAAADRERTLDVLKAAYGEGRLTDAEFESRAARTMSAKYYGDLAAIVGDLPAGPFAPQGPGYYPPAVPVEPTNGLAVGSLVCSLVGLIMPLMLVPGLVMGHIARDQIRAREQRGDGFAVAGLVFGYLGIAVWVLIIALVASRH